MLTNIRQDDKDLDQHRLDSLAMSTQYHPSYETGDQASALRVSAAGWDS